MSDLRQFLSFAQAAAFARTEAVRTRREVRLIPRSYGGWDTLVLRSESEAREALEAEEASRLDSEFAESEADDRHARFDAETDLIVDEAWDDAEAAARSKDGGWYEES